MKTHTPEPWHQSHRKITDSGGIYNTYNTEIYDSEGKTIATLHWYAIKGGEGITTTNREENACRIVACVNACAGIDTDLLETAYSKGWVSGMAGHMNAIKQLDELLAAMKDGADKLENDGDELGVAADLRAAIAKAESR